MIAPNAYSFSFTAASLRPELVATLADQFFRAGSWEAAKRNVLATNALQARSPASAIRMERELRQRLQKLTPEQLRLIPGSTSDLRTAVAWLSTVKHVSFLFEFSGEVLRGKWEAHDPVLRASDYEHFVEEKQAKHPEIASLSHSSATKVRNVSLLMLREAGLLVADSALGLIHRPNLPPLLEAAIRSDNPRWLAGFLVSDKEIGNTSRRP